MKTKETYIKPEVQLEEYEPVNDILTVSSGLEYGNTDETNP